MKRILLFSLLLITPLVNAQSPDFTATFENSDEGFVLVNGTQTNAWVIGQAVASGSASALYISNDGGTTNSYTTSSTSITHAYKDIAIPVGMTTLTISFDWKGMGENGFDYMRLWSAPTTYTPVAGTQTTVAGNAVQIGGNFVSAGNWSTYTTPINVSPFAGTTRRFIFEWRNDGANGANPPAAIDNINFSQACAQPIDLVASNITLTSAMLSWTETATATAWEVNVVPAGSVPTGVGMITTTNPFVITGLTPNTCYSYYVRAVCDAQNESPWSGPLNFCVGENYSNITGFVHFDANGDGICGNTDAAVTNVELQVSVNGTAAGSVYTNADGQYNYYLPPGESYTVTFTPVAPSGFTSPDAITATYTTTPGQSTLAGPDFCIMQPENPVSNLGIMVTPTGQTVPGFATSLLFTVQNTGTLTMANASATLSFDNSRFTLVSIDGAPATGSSPVQFTFTDMDPFEISSHIIVLQCLAPPVNNGGDQVTFTASLDIEDDNPNDNVYSAEQTIINSFDPNDITVHQGAEIIYSEVPNYLTYTIRFENTGNGPAQNVKVMQQLDENLDWATFQTVAASHGFEAERESGAVTFSFNNINLPFSTPGDQLTGHGFVTYRVKPKSTVTVGDIILGSAGIYFDFNEPVITNTCSTEVVELSAGTHGFAANAIKLYPNPVNDKLNISITNGTLLSIQVYDLNGRLCLTSGSVSAIDTHPLSPGLYLVKISTDKGTGNYKLIKE